MKRMTPKRPRVVAPAGPFASVNEAIDDIRRGKMVIVVDDEDRENEGDLTMAAELARPSVVRESVSATTSTANPCVSRSTTVRHAPATLTLASTPRSCATPDDAISSRRPDAFGPVCRTVPISATMPVNI